MEVTISASSGWKFQFYDGALVVRAGLAGFALRACDSNVQWGVSLFTHARKVSRIDGSERAGTDNYEVHFTIPVSEKQNRQWFI